jgi:hypothetical protein
MTSWTHPHVIVGRLGSTDAAVIERALEATNTVDVLASWVVHACRQRSWPALTTDPARLRRLDPRVPIDLSLIFQGCPRSPDASPPNSLTHHDDAADHLTSWTATTDTGADFPGLRVIPNGIRRQWLFSLVARCTGLGRGGSSCPAYPSQRGR